MMLPDAITRTCVSRFIRARYIACAFLMLRASFIYAGDPLLFEYQSNIDQEVSAVIGVAPDTGSLLILTKEFLSQRKRQVDPLRSESELYVIRDVASDERTTLINVARSEKVVIGKIADLHNRFLIPVIRNHSTVEVYAYHPHDQSTEMIGQNNPGKYLSAVYAVSDGYIVISSKRERIDATYYAYDGSFSKTLTDGISAAIIGDITEIDGVIYITGVGNAGDKYQHIWQISASRSGGSSLDLHIDIIKSAPDITTAKYIPSTHNKPSLLISHTSLIPLTNKADVSIESFDEGTSTVWEKTLPSILADRNYSAAGVCKRDYLIAERKTERDPFRNYIEFSYTGNSSKDIEYPIIEQKHTNLINILMYPNAGSVYVATNFSKLEDTRRDGGWWSWYGYQVNLININKLCNI